MQDANLIITQPFTQKLWMRTFQKENREQVERSGLKLSGIGI